MSIRKLLILVFVVVVGMATYPAQAASPMYPIVDVASGYLLGGTRDGKWLNDRSAAPLLKGGEQYRVYTMTRNVGKATGGKPTSIGEPCLETLSVKLTPDPAGARIAVGGSWNALPRVPVALSNNTAVYRTAVSDFLKKQGIASPQVILTKVLRIDLEGDKVDEVLISAARLQRNDDGSVTPVIAAGDYSIVLMRKVINGKVETTLIAGEFYTKASEFAAPSEYTISTLLDLNGDKTMEVVIDSEYYEGASTGVFRIAGKIAALVLGTGCGV